MELDSPKCVVCGEVAITTVCHFLVCKEHDRLYREEGRKYLPQNERVVFNEIIDCGEKNGTNK